MKKRIAAMLLAVVMVCNIAGNAKPAKAAAAAAFEEAALIAITYATSYLYAVMTGRTADSVEISDVSVAAIQNVTLGGMAFGNVCDAISYIADSGLIVDAFVGTEDTPSWFVSGWTQIFSTVGSWFDSGDVSLSDDGLSLSYSQYVTLVGTVAALDPSVSLGDFDINYKIYPATEDIYYVIDSSFVLSFDDLASGVSYSPLYFTNDAMYFSSNFFFLQAYPENGHIASWRTFYGYNLVDQIKTSEVIRGFGNYKYASVIEYLIDMGFKILSNASIFTYKIEGYCYDDPFSNSWYMYDGSTISAVDNIPTTARFAYITVAGKINDFVARLLDYGSTISMTPNDDIDDLSDALDDLLVLNPDPGLVVDTDPTIEIPTDAILITDITGVEDMTLTDALEDVRPRLDLEIPTSIWDKFPFSLPFDFYRLLTIFVAEPKAPVFRVPISNVNVDMSAYKDNQTFGEYLAANEDSELMFEIDKEIVIDLSGLPFVQAISYTCFIVGWVALLIFATSKLIHH